MKTVDLEDLPPRKYPRRLLAPQPNSQERQSVISAAEKLVRVHLDELLTENNPVACCVCIRSGLLLLASTLTIGPDFGLHLENFRLWRIVLRMPNHYVLLHRLMCLDPLLLSVLNFLKYCPDLLLSVLDALIKSTLMLE